IRGQQGRLWMSFFEVFQDSNRLPNRYIVIDQRGDQLRGIHHTVAIGKLLPAFLEQMHRNRLIRQPLEVERDTNTISSRAAKITIQLHVVSLSFRDNSRGKGNAIPSGVPSRVRTDTAPSVLSRSITCWTRISGAEAPAVTPTRRAPWSQAGSIWSALSTRCACAPLRSATSRNR